ncbi:MAG: hypothetical protein AABW48_00990 [Nanoarchaeota archaeon]
MFFQKSLDDGYAKKIEKDKIRAKSLIKSANDALLAAKELQLKEHNYKSILRELYEALRQYCEAIGYLQGYKFNSHEVITLFLKDLLNKESISLKFDYYRKLRNGINYYGRDISKETVEKALKEIPKIIKELQNHLKF